MKKLLAMILMLVLSGIALAAEVKLRCEVTSRDDAKTIAQEIFSYDEAAMTVLGQPANNPPLGSCNGTKGICNRPFISDEEVWIETFKDGEFVGKRTLDRMTGGFVINHYGADRRFPDLSGSCARFNQSF